MWEYPDPAHVRKVRENGGVSLRGQSYFVSRALINERFLSGAVEECSTPATAKLRAADMVLDIATRGLEFQDLNIRLQELERSPRLKAPEKSVPEPASSGQQHDIHEEKQNDETDRPAD